MDGAIHHLGSQLKWIGPTKNPARTSLPQSRERIPTKMISLIIRAQTTNAHITIWSTDWHDRVC